MRGNYTTRVEGRLTDEQERDYCSHSEFVTVVKSNHRRHPISYRTLKFLYSPV